jgi:transposase-like protein
MTKIEAKPAIASVNELFAKSPDGLREIVRAVMQEMLEAEMTDALGAEKGQRTVARLGYRSGYYSRTLVTRVGKLELRVPHEKLVGWVEETLTFYRLPRQHHKHLKSTNMLERLNEEIRRRTYVVRIFPNSTACRRLIRPLAVETHENWLEAHRYLNMNDLKEHKKIHLPQAA